MPKTCPISKYKIDLNIVRVSATIVTLLSIIFILSSNIFIVIFMIFDFSLRAARKRKLSLMFHIASFIKTTLKLPILLEDEEPKRFALFVGIAMLVLILITSLLGFTLASKILMFALIACAGAEAVFSYCVGCEIYHLLKKLKRSEK